MKKVLLIAAATAALSTSAMADTENMFYLRGDLGAAWFQKANDKATGLKMKGRTSLALDLGAGYYFMDNVRGELVYGHQFNPELKKSGTVSGISGSVKHKADINSLMLKGYVDVADVSVAKIFVGAGFGWAQVSEKITWSESDGWSASAKAKKKNNVAFSATIGSGFDLADGVKADIRYEFSDFGKTKSKLGFDNKTEVAKTSYRSHNVKVGVRFDI